MKLLLDLFLTFAKIGAFTFGGGLAMISIIENKCVEQKKWITHDEMMNMTIIAESTPGPIAINCATYTGYKKAGFLGAAFATLGMVLPSFFIIYLISVFLDNFLDYTIVAKAFSGIKIAVGILILDAGINMVKKMKKNALTLILMIGSFVAMLGVNILAWNFSSVTLMLISAFISLNVFLIKHFIFKKGGACK